MNTLSLQPPQFLGAMDNLGYYVRNKHPRGWAGIVVYTHLTASARRTAIPVLRVGGPPLAGHSHVLRVGNSSIRRLDSFLSNELIPLTWSRSIWWLVLAYLHSIKRLEVTTHNTYNPNASGFPWFVGIARAVASSLFRTPKEDENHTYSSSYEIADKHRVMWDAHHFRRFIFPKSDWNGVGIAHLSLDGMVLDSIPIVNMLQFARFSIWLTGLACAINNIMVEHCTATLNDTLSNVQRRNCVPRIGVNDFYSMYPCPDEGFVVDRPPMFSSTTPVDNVIPKAARDVISAYPPITQFL